MMTFFDTAGRRDMPAAGPGGRPAPRLTAALGQGAALLLMAGLHLAQLDQISLGLAYYTAVLGLLVARVRGGAPGEYLVAGRSAGPGRVELEPCAAR